MIEASEQRPFLAMALKLEMSVVRELLSREEIPASGPVAPPAAPPMESAAAV